MLGILYVVLSFFQDKGLIDGALTFVSWCNINKEFMELLSRINLLCLILKDYYSLALIKSKINNLLMMSFNKHFFYFLQR